MRLLAIETATQVLGAAVIDETRILATSSLLIPHPPHAAELPGLVDRLLRASRTEWSALDGIVLDSGPGSFTGLRIGASFAKALAFARKLPLVAVPSLDVLAAGVPFSPLPVFPVLDAKRKSIYGAVYEPGQAGLKRRTEYALASPEEIVAGCSGPAAFLGDACPLYGARLLNLRPGSVILPEDFWWPKPETLARLGRERFLAGQRDDAGKFIPLYLYPLDCSIRKEAQPVA